MRRINLKIILVLLLILFTILMLYYHFYVRKIELSIQLTNMGGMRNVQMNDNLENLENLENFAIPDMFPDENYDDGASTFLRCDPAVNSLCTTTYDMLENNNADFMNTNSKYYNHYKLSNIQNSSHAYRNYDDIMTNKDILAYRCLKKSPKDLHTELKNRNVACIYKTMYLYDDTSLYSYITTQLTEITMGASTLKIDTTMNKNTNKILGPVYVCISQAPFLQYNGDMIKARFDVTNNQRPYYKEEIIGGQRRYEMESGFGQDNQLSSLYAEILLIFAMYDVKEKDSNNNATKMSFNNDERNIGKFETDISVHFIQDKLCFLKCNKSPFSCGCLNATTTDMTGPDVYKRGDLNANSMTPYTSVCYNHNNVAQNYSILYYVNPYGTNRDLIVNINR